MKNKVFSPVISSVKEVKSGMDKSVLAVILTAATLLLVVGSTLTIWVYQNSRDGVMPLFSSLGQRVEMFQKELVGDPEGSDFGEGGQDQEYVDGLRRKYGVGLDESDPSENADMPTDGISYDLKASYIMSEYELKIFRQMVIDDKLYFDVEVYNKTESAMLSPAHDVTVEVLSTGFFLAPYFDPSGPVKVWLPTYLIQPKERVREWIAFEGLPSIEEPLHLTFSKPELLGDQKGSQKVRQVDLVINWGPN